MLTKAVFAAWMHAYGYALVTPSHPVVLPPALVQFGTTGPQVVKALEFNRAYQKHLQERLDTGMETSRQEAIWEALSEARALYSTWDKLDDCFRGQADCREYNLNRLRERIGPEAFGYGRMPPCVPIWRFQER